MFVYDKKLEKDPTLFVDGNDYKGKFSHTFSEAIFHYQEDDQLESDPTEVF